MVQIALRYTKFSSAGQTHRLSGAFVNSRGVLLQILLQKGNGLDLLLLCCSSCGEANFPVFI